jgi:glutathione synthase/RimK-type ligase-like ATP-grasp enzyme
VILLWGLATDGPLAAVRAHLERSGARLLLLDQGSPQSTRIERRVDENGRGALQVNGQSVDLGDVSAAYLSPYDTRALAASLGCEVAEHARDLEETIGSWAELTPARVLNRPSDMASNNSKPYQLALLRAAGFDVPATLVTTDPDAVLDFWKRHERVVYKSTSGERSIVSRLSDRHRGYLDEVSHCPTQFQEYIVGCDYRVHVVGDEVFPCRIESTADDYRYPDPQVAGTWPALHPAEVPPAIARRCVDLAGRLRLALVGIDLRLTPAGRWVAFEANPSPAFSYYEQATGLPIAASVARVLARR